VSAPAWRRAMNTPVGTLTAPGVQAMPFERPGHAPLALGQRLRAIRPRHLIVLAALLIYPWVATPFFTFQIGGQALVLGLIALSLTFLAGYGGMVSLAQMTVAGIAGYCVAIFGDSSVSQISLGWAWPWVLLMAIAVAVLVSAVIGWLSVRTEGIYTIMITLAIGVAFYYLCVQNYTLFNGHAGFHHITTPQVLDVAWRDPVPYYYLALFWAMAGYFLITYLLRAPFGLALQGIRDNARRMNALGFNVTAHRVAAYAVSGLLAGVGGVLLAYYNGLVTPGTVNTGALINILIIAVLGGMRHPIGPFVGAVVFVLMQTFGIDLASQLFGDWARERFNLVIGMVFLLIVLFSPDGLLGWWTQLRARLRPSGGAGRSIPAAAPH